MANETSGIKKFINSLAVDQAVKQEQINALDRLQDAVTERREAAATDIETLSSITKSAINAIEVNMSEIKAKFKEAGKTQAEYREELAKLKKIKGELTEEQKKDIALYEKEIPLLQKKQQEAKKLLIIEKSNKTVIEASSRALKEKLGLGYEMNESFLGSLTASDNAFKAIKSSIQEVIKPQKLYASALHQIQKATLEFNKELDTESVALQKATGGALGMNDGLISMTTQNRRFNADLKTTNESIQALNNNMSLFNQMSLEQRNQLVDTTVKLRALGVSAETAGKSFDVMINSLGMTQDMANEATMELVALANATGMAADVVISEFGDASSELSKYGANMVKEFKAIAGAAEATGIKISSLMSITKQFDTFEGAATHAGKLNAILGGGVINSMDLLNATEEERVRLLIQSIQASGKNFENMNRFEKQAVMNAAGITNMNEAQKLFTQSLSEYDMQVEKAKAAEQSNAEFEEMAANMTTLSDKLKQIGKTFAVSFGPVIQILSLVASFILAVSDGINYLINVIDDFVGYGIVRFIAGLSMAIGIMRLARKVISNTAKSMAKDIGEGLGEGVGKAVEAVGEGVSATIDGVSNSIAAAAPKISPAIVSIGSSMATAAPGVGAFGVSLAAVVLPIAAIVAAVALLVASIALLIYAVISLAKEVGGDQLFKVAIAFQVFALGLGQGLGLISASFVAFVATLMAVTYTSMGLVPMLTFAFAGLMAVIAGIALALFALPNEKLINLNIATQGLSKMMDSAVNLTPESVKHTKELVDAAADYVMIQAEMLTPDMDSFVQAMKGAFGGGKSGKGQDIVLVLNDREFGRAVDAAINRSNNLSID